MIQSLLRCFREPSVQTKRQQRMPTSVHTNSPFLYDDRVSTAESSHIEDVPDPKTQRRLGDVLKNLDCLNRDSARVERQCRQLLKEGEAYNSLLTRLLEKYNGNSFDSQTNVLERKGQGEALRKKRHSRKASPTNSCPLQWKKDRRKSWTTSGGEDPLEYFKSLYFRDRQTAREMRPCPSIHSKISSGHEEQPQNMWPLLDTRINSIECKAFSHEEEALEACHSQDNAIQSVDGDPSDEKIPSPTAIADQTSQPQLDTVVSDLIEGIVHQAVDVNTNLLRRR